MAENDIRSKHDVVIIGAGPAGSTLGYLLADKGIDVLVIDKEIFPRPKVCTGTVTWKTRHLIEDLYQTTFDEQFFVECVTPDYFLFEKYKLKTFQESPEPFYFIDRAKYDMELVTLAKKRNCQFLLGQRAAGVDETRNIVTTQSGDSYSGRIIVGADGAKGITRKKLFPLDHYKRNLALAFQTRVPGDMVQVEYQSPTPKLFLGAARSGYGWIFPNKDSFLIGLCGLVRKNRKLNERFIKFLSRVSLSMAPAANLESHVVPFGSFLEAPGKDWVLLIGDAAGYVDPLTGEGIYYAHKTAQLASKTIIDFFDASGRIDLIQLYRAHLHQVYSELVIAKRFRRMAYSRLRLLGYPFLSQKLYTKLGKLIHGLISYNRLPLFSKWVVKINGAVLEDTIIVK